MEKRRPIFHLMTKFSHAVWILKYYGNYYDWEKLMRCLCSKASVVWDVIHKSLVNNGRRNLTYSQPFDDSITQFLLPEKYKKYSLSVCVDSLESGQALLSFIKSVPEFYELRFNSIKWELEEDSPCYLQFLYKTLVMLNLPDTVFENNHARFVYEYLQFDSLKNYIIPYVNYLERIEEWKYADKVGSLEVTASDIDLNKFKDVKCEIREFIIRQRETVDLFMTRSLKFHQNVQLGLKSLYFMEVPLAWIALGIQAISKFCKNLDSFRIYLKKTSDLNLGLFDNIQKLQGKMSCTSIALNYESHTKPTIVKSFMKLAYKEGKTVKIIKTSKAFIQLSDTNEEIVHHTPEYIVFSKFMKCKFNDVTVINECDSNLFKSISRHKLNLRDSCFVIFNGYYDEVSINSYDSLLALNPYGCSILNFTINDEYKGLRFIKFCNFFKRVSIFTKVALCLEMDQKPFHTLFEMLDVLFDLDIVMLEILTKPEILDRIRRKEKLLEKILQLHKLRVYKDDQLTVNWVDQYYGKKKMTYFVKKLIGAMPDEETEDYFTDHLFIE